MVYVGNHGNHGNQPCVHRGCCGHLCCLRLISKGGGGGGGTLAYSLVSSTIVRARPFLSGALPCPGDCYDFNLSRTFTTHDAIMQSIPTAWVRLSTWPNTCHCKRYANGTSKNVIIDARAA